MYPRELSCGKTFWIIELLHCFKIGVINIFCLLGRELLFRIS